MCLSWTPNSGACIKHGGDLPPVGAADEEAGYGNVLHRCVCHHFMLPQDCIPFLNYSLSLLLPVTLPVLAEMQTPQKQLRHHTPECRPHAGNSVVLLAVKPVSR